MATSVAQLSRSAADTVPAALWCAAAALFLPLFLVKSLLAAELELFGDGAFYWLEAQYPALSYSDVPFLTPALVAIGTEVAGNTPFGVRWPFLAVGSLLPLAVYWVARPLTGRRDAVLAAMFSMLIPVPALLGLLAIPDVPLLLLQVLCFGALERAVRQESLGWWVVTGLIAALALNAHYRFAFFGLGALLFMLTARSGRAMLVTPAPWVALALAGFGALPVLWFNISNDLAGVAFHFVDRHPWQFNPEGLLYLFEQAVWVTPLLFAAFAAALWRVTENAMAGDPPAHLAAAMAFAYLAPFTALSPWAVAGNTTTGHWAIFAYVALLPWLPGTLRAIKARGPGGRVFAWSVPASAAALLFLALKSITLTAFYERVPTALRGFATDKLSGWEQLADDIERRLVATPEAGGTIVTNRYDTAAQIAFWLERPSGIYNIDDLKIFRRGRAAQRAIWGFDIAGLRRDRPGGAAFIVIEGHDPPGALGPFCELFDEVRPLGRFSLFEGERRYGYYLGLGLRDKAGAPGVCIR